MHYTALTIAETIAVTIANGSRNILHCKMCSCVVLRIENGRKKGLIYDLYITWPPLEIRMEWNLTHEAMSFVQGDIVRRL